MSDDATNFRIERKYMDAYLSGFVMNAKAREKVIESTEFPLSKNVEAANS